MENKSEYVAPTAAVPAVNLDLEQAQRELARSNDLLTRLLRLAGLLADELRVHAPDCSEACVQRYRLFDLEAAVKAFLAGGEINVVTSVHDEDDKLTAWRVLSALVEDANGQAGVLVERCEAAQGDWGSDLYAEAVLARAILERVEQIVAANVQGLEEDAARSPLPAAHVLANK